MKTSLTAQMIPDYKSWDIHNNSSDNCMNFNSENPYGSLNWMANNDPNFWANIMNSSDGLQPTVLNSYNYFNPSDISSLVSHFNQLKYYTKCNNQSIPTQENSEKMVPIQNMVHFSPSLTVTPKSQSLINPNYLNQTSQPISQPSVTYCNDFNPGAPNYGKYQPNKSDELCNSLAYQSKCCSRESSNISNNFAPVYLNGMPKNFEHNDGRMVSSQSDFPPLMYFLDSLNLPHVSSSDKQFGSFNLKNIYVPPECTYKFDAELTLSSNLSEHESANGKPPNSRGNAEYLCSFPGVSWNTRMQSWLVYYEDLTGRKSKTFNPKRFSVDKLDKNNDHYEKLKNLDPMIIAMHFACAFASEARYKARLFKNYNLPLARACKKFFRKRSKTETKKHKPVLDPFNLLLESNNKQQSPSLYVVMNNLSENRDKLLVSQNNEPVKGSHYVQCDKQNLNNCNFITETPSSVISSDNDSLLNHLYEDNSYYSTNFINYKSPEDKKILNSVYDVDLEYRKHSREADSQSNCKAYNNTYCDGSNQHDSVLEKIKISSYPSTTSNQFTLNRLKNGMHSNLNQFPMRNNHILSCLCPSKHCHVHNSIETTANETCGHDNLNGNKPNTFPESALNDSLRCVESMPYCDDRQYYYNNSMYSSMSNSASECNTSSLQGKSRNNTVIGLVTMPTAYLSSYHKETEHKE